MYVHTMYKIVTYVCTTVIVISFRVYCLLLFISFTFLNQAHTCFLEIAFIQEVGMRVCVFVYVCVCVRPWAIKNYSLEMNSD